MSAPPVFMSAQHVETLNRRLGESAAVADSCSRLERDLCLLYELAEGPEGSTVYWRTDFLRSGSVRFSMQRGEGAIDVVIAGKYWDVLDAVQGKRPMPTPTGRAGDIEILMSLLTSEGMRACAVAAVFPTRAAGV